MNDQLELGFDLKERGQLLALSATSDWNERALEWLRGAYGAYTADDLIEAIGLPHEVASNRNNSVGAIFSAARKQGIIRRVGWAQSRRKESHGRVIAQWETM